LVGPPQKQLVCASTPYRATQEGEAVGYRQYPTPPVPTWPSSLVRAGDFDRVSPRRRGKIAGSAGYEEFRVTWRYEFESATAFGNALPNVWKG
jgi:hypothetical protein